MLSEEYMNFLKDEKKSLIVLFMVYPFTNIFLLLNIDGIYWDDWVLYNHSFEVIHSMFKQASGSIGIITTIIQFISL